MYLPPRMNMTGRSLSRTASVILVMAIWSPSARTTLAWASSLLASILPSAWRIAAAFSPSALVTVALRARSAAACSSMARCMVSEGLISWISTVLSMMPQSAMSSEMLSLSRALIFSRDDRASSRFISPMMERSDVWTRFWMARR
ncbi:MAG: hypothetical protein BWX71_02686 [Deltaproteobacteria bacterium ADurb.Bin072]|nr:MAG: hypothetical protein BWX71_02686 [Deltaproteobacteria bacterium ADurb.Bin072]